MENNNERFLLNIEHDGKDFKVCFIDPYRTSFEQETYVLALVQKLLVQINGLPFQIRMQQADCNIKCSFTCKKDLNLDLKISGRYIQNVMSEVYLIIQNKIALRKKTPSLYKEI